MKRDMDLVRNILIALADEPRGHIDTKSDAVNYHLEMLIEKQFVNGITVAQSHGGRYSTNLTNSKLTWAGHEFLATIRSKTVWDKIKNVIKDKGLDLSVEAIKIAAPNVLASILK